MAPMAIGTPTATRPVTSQIGPAAIDQSMGWWARVRIESIIVSPCGAIIPWLSSGCMGLRKSDQDQEEDRQAWDGQEEEGRRGEVDEFHEDSVGW